MLDLSPTKIAAKQDKAGLLLIDDLSRRLEQAEESIEQLKSTFLPHLEEWIETRREMNFIQSLFGWRLLRRYYQIRERLLPEGTWRRQAFLAASSFALGLVRNPNKEIRRRLSNEYELWIRTHEPARSELSRQKRTVFPWMPQISILVAVNNPQPEHLKPMVQSVFDQTYPHWEFCLTCRAGETAFVRALLDKARQTHKNVHILPLAETWSTSGAYERAVSAASGQFVTLLGQHDALAPSALFDVVQALNESPTPDFLYCDEDTLSTTGARRSNPHFKPDWSPDTFRSHNYIGNLAVLRKSLVEQVGGCRTGYGDPRHYDLLLRASEQAACIVHIPKVLYHARASAPLLEVAHAPVRKNLEVEKKALTEHLARIGKQGDVSDGLRPGTYRVTYPLTTCPRVSILIPNRDNPATLLRCIRSIRGSSYKNYEIIIIENHSKLRETFACYQMLGRQPRTQTLTWSKPFNYAAVNNFAARHAQGEVLLFLNNDAEVINPDWLERMLEHALRQEIGAVGAKLYYPDETIQHAGVIIGLSQGVHYQRRMPRSSAGYANRLVTIQNLSAVTGACLMTRREVFENVGGFDEIFCVLYNDLDLCLRIREQGYLIVWSPYAELYHHEVLTRGRDTSRARTARDLLEIMLFNSRWRAAIEKGDCYYSPNLTGIDESCSLRFA